MVLLNLGIISPMITKVGTQYCGLIMGDHSKSGINTMFNTGSVVGFLPIFLMLVFHLNSFPHFHGVVKAGL